MPRSFGAYLGEGVLAFLCGAIGCGWRPPPFFRPNRSKPVSMACARPGDPFLTRPHVRFRRRPSSRFCEKGMYEPRKTGTLLMRWILVDEKSLL